MTIDNDFYFLTSDAGFVDLKKDSSARAQVTFSSGEVLEALRRIKANKQILLMDACYSGKLTDFFNINSKASNTYQQKVLESIKDRKGTYILASSESNKKSYEVLSLNQGLLTHSLLLGMSGEGNNDDKIDIVNLLNFASQQTEELSKNILGYKQRPVMGIGDGGTSFDIGKVNPDIKPAIYSNYIRLGKSKFGLFPSLNDPEQLENKFNARLKQLGVFGGSENFIYQENATGENVYRLAGTYSVSDDSMLNLRLFVIKDNEIINEDGKEYTIELSTIDEEIVKIIQEAVSSISNTQ